VIVLLGTLHVAPALAVNGSVIYTYDALGRVSTASYDTGVCIIYTYDAAGNRTAQTFRVSGTGSTGVWGCFNWGKRCGGLKRPVWPCSRVPSPSGRELG